jgi:hypothetical protein
MFFPRPARPLVLAAFLVGISPSVPSPEVRAGNAPVAPGIPAAPVRLQVLASQCSAGPPSGCPLLGQASECFDPLVGDTYVNVGSFFGAGEVSSSDHYFLKLYRNGTAGAVRLRGMGFQACSSHGHATNTFMAAGAIFAGTEAVLPKPEALASLAEVGIQGEDRGTTCVEFTFGIDSEGRGLGEEIVLQSGEAAWLALRFASYPDSIFVGVRVDGDANDRRCDYLTRDGGEYWYQPDPLHGPFFDWGITAYTEVRPGSTEPPPTTWTLVKRLYRD